MTRIRRRKRKRPKITKEPLTFYNMTLDEIDNFVNAPSVGAYYLKHLKGKGVMRSTISKRLGLNQQSGLEKGLIGLQGTLTPFITSIVRTVSKNNQVVKEAFKIHAKIREVKG